MPRKPRVSPIGISQHVIQRGNNRQACFTSEQDFKAYAGWLKEYSRKFHVEIHVIRDTDKWDKWGQSKLKFLNYTL